MSTGRLGAGDTAIQPTIFDAKADILTATAADTPARLAVGNNGETLVADSSATTGLRYQAIQAAGRNVLINSDFRINQRNTGLTSTSTTFVVDRFSLNFSGGTCSGEQKTFSPGSGITGLASVEHFLEYISSGQSGTSDQLRCRGAFEDVYTFAGETVTFSFYAKATSGTPKIALGVSQNFGSGGSSTVTTKVGEATLSTSFARYSITFTMPSISGKTIGAGNFNTIQFFMSAGTAVDGGIWGIGVQNNTFQFTAFQLEQGSVATPFTTATGTLAGELAACQRYYFNLVNGNNLHIGVGSYEVATAAMCGVQFPVTMRTAPTLSATSGTDYYRAISSGGGSDNFNSFTIVNANTTGACIYNNSEISGTAGQACRFISTNASSFVSFVSEL